MITKKTDLDTQAELPDVTVKDWTSPIVATALFAGFIIALANNTWNVFLVMGGGSALIFLLTRGQIGDRRTRSFSIPLLFGVLGSMILIQAKGSLPLHLLVIPLFISLVFYLRWKTYIPFTLVILAAMSGLALVQNQGSESYLLLNSAPADFKAIAVYVLLVLLFAIFCGFLAKYMKSLTQKNQALCDRLNRLEASEQSNVEFARQIASGNFEANRQLHEDDMLGRSLIEMSANLRNAAVAEKQRNWSVEGIAQIADILRINHENINELAYHVVAHLVKYMKANQGGIFIINDHGEDTCLELKGCYAFDRRKYLEKKIMIGEGLVGQAYLEKEMIFMTEAPENYVRITSGLGGANPRSIIIVPLKMEDQVIGVIELASFTEFQPYQRDFLVKVSENIASAIISSKVKDQTNRLLQESQALTEQMRAQEEEMRQNMEELQATQESLQRESGEKEKIQKEIEKTRDFLQNVINAIPDPVFVKEEKGHSILMVNKAFMDQHQVRDVAGRNDYDLFDRKLADEFNQCEKEIFQNRNESEREERFERNGRTVSYLTKRRVFQNEDGALYLVGISHDISDIKKIQEQLAKEKYLLDALMQNSNDYIYFKDRESKFIRVSSHMLGQFKVNSNEELAGKSDFDIFTEEHARPAYEAEQEIIRTGNPILNLIEKETWDDGTVTYVSTTKMPLKNQEGAVVGTFGISRDVTESRVAELEMQKTEKLTESIFKYTSEGVLLVSRDNMCTFVSSNLATALKYSQDEMKKQSITDFLHPADKKKFAAAIGAARKNLESNAALRFRTGDGSDSKLNVSFWNAQDEEAIDGILCRVSLS